METSAGEGITTVTGRRFFNALFSPGRRGAVLADQLGQSLREQKRPVAALHRRRHSRVGTLDTTKEDLVNAVTACNRFCSRARDLRQSARRMEIKVWKIFSRNMNGCKLTRSFGALYYNCCCLAKNCQLFRSVGLALASLGGGYHVVICTSVHLLR